MGQRYTNPRNDAGKIPLSPGFIAPDRAPKLTATTAPPTSEDDFRWQPVEEAPLMPAPRSFAAPEGGEGLSLGQKLLLSAAGLAVVGGAVSYRPEVPIQSELTAPITRSERRGLDNLRVLEQYASRYGGSFEVPHSLLGDLYLVQARHVNEVYQSLADGDTVVYKVSPEAKGLELRSFEQVQEVSDHIRVRRLEDKVDETLDELEGEIHDALDTLRDLFD